MKGLKVIAMGRVNWEHPINKSIPAWTSCQINECKIDVGGKELKSHTIS